MKKAVLYTHFGSDTLPVYGDAKPAAHRTLFDCIEELVTTSDCPIVPGAHKKIHAWVLLVLFKQVIEVSLPIRNANHFGVRHFTRYVHTVTQALNPGIGALLFNGNTGWWPFIVFRFYLPSLTLCSQYPEWQTVRIYYKS